MAKRPQPRILCLDGGGIRGLAEILILKELMLQVQLQNNLDFMPEPIQCFDYICGTSTGGLIAVLIGRLGKTLDECEAFFRDFGSKIFSGGSSSKAASLVFKGSQHNGERLADVVRSQAGQEKLYEADASASGHVPIAVVSVSRVTRDDYLFRSYGARAANKACTIVDACLATSAATTFFPSVTIDGVEYIDGAFGKNNPSGVVLKELESVESPLQLANSVAEVGCFVSIGAGRPTFDRERDSFKFKITPKGITSIADAASICVKIATDCHNEHFDVEYSFKRAGRPDVYYRFDVDRGLESVELNEADEKTLRHISAVTMSYLQAQQSSLEQCARLINPRRGM
ncbi:acyl transferase/acyl hydrolase/lysophospholipase [Colletotrichum cereale]|nr:acyl transferase/acyl hydrolase/lysophospholipase [Colletotrichum cereale]